MLDIKALRNSFEAYRQQHAFSQAPQRLYEPVEYIMSSSGKRLRPVLVLMGGALFKGDMAYSLPVAMAVEIFHNFSLVHDDIMDEAPLRRGRPAVHTKYGLNTGILSGDVMLIYAYQFLSKGGKTAKEVADLLDVFNTVAIEVCEGQQFDVDFESRNDVTISEYINMIELKTAALVGGSLQMGGITAGAPPEAQHQLRDFGRNIGIAFQLQDDILDTFGDPEKVGKRVGGDILQNKKTFLILKALELAEGETYKTLHHLMTTNPEDEDSKVRTVTQILRELSIPAWAEQQKQQYQDRAFSALDALEAPKQGKQQLQALAEQLLVRES
ncbi:MAG: polyprenyl synthetase family protein [Phaeodactylibacter xiamenensis]|uniref:Polyprenyl synthetase n=1 Tax=Phaeodactylibacter xiamenensis TaxID=1524460 RepID=A0A098S454_9BACT|nr:polyprenyl synthetase family protein [Phaeodactylibacter xiamenensis]KGE86885.1 polyprenyl synthetase [Phaeodactylibacter xiamenensis]MCR9052427.1 polyprenyl synthetase family protein [bacterium]